MNGASEGACVVTFGSLDEGDIAAGGLLDTDLTAQVEVGKWEKQSQDPVGGSLGRESGLVVR